jgi:hypothetical protein
MLILEVYVFFVVSNFVNLCRLFIENASIAAIGDALYALRWSFDDPWNVLQSWHQTLLNPCAWIHVIFK